MSCKTTCSATVFWIWRTVTEYVVPQFISSLPNELRNSFEKKLIFRSQTQQNPFKYPINPLIYYVYLKCLSNVVLLKDNE